MKFNIALACAIFAAPIMLCAAELGPNDYPFAKGEILTYDFNRNAVRKGTFDGSKIDYQINKNGLIEVSSGWKSICVTDKITDERSCAISNSKANFGILFDGSGVAQSICLNAHDYPGKHGAIRIDSNTPHITDIRGCVGPEVLEELVHGKNITTRQIKFPNELPSDYTTTSNGLGDTILLMKHVMKYSSKIGIY